MKRKRRNIIIITTLLVAGLIYVIFTGIRKTSVYYFTFDEFLQKKNEINSKVVRISGNVVPNSIKVEKGIANFLIGNQEKNLKVIYKGALPDLIYQDSVKVVIEGTYKPLENTFYATFLMTQCPSKYQAEKKKAE